METYDFKKGIPPNLFTVMKKAYERSSLMGCTIDVSSIQAVGLVCVSDQLLLFSHLNLTVFCQEIDVFNAFICQQFKL